MAAQHPAVAARCGDLSHQIMQSSAPQANKTAALGWLTLVMQLLSAAPEVIADIQPLITDIENLLNGGTPTPAPAS